MKRFLLLLVVSVFGQSSDQCAVSDSQKSECGNKFTSQSSCEKKGCCWEDQGLFSLTPSCFNPAAPDVTTTLDSPQTTTDAPQTTTKPPKTKATPDATTTLDPSSTPTTSTSATSTPASSTSNPSSISSGVWVGIGIAAFFVAFGVGTLMYHNISKARKTGDSKLSLSPNANSGAGGGSLVPKASPFGAAAVEPTPQYAAYTIERPVAIPQPPTPEAPAQYPATAYPDGSYPADYYPPTQAYPASNAGYQQSNTGYPQSEPYYDQNATGFYNNGYNQQYAGSAVGTNYNAYPQSHVEPQTYHPNYNNTPPPSGYSAPYPQ
ncbi:hypothetical protein HDV01_007085 [Terramyces sp. JEL0728]|nr:hypothetical protein HDV01_007085 [Terramyces sp. JEL0728]